MLLVPVAIRQIHSMQSLQIHAPEMKAIQQRYKADRQRQSEELMKFYKENKINPYASCLPIVFQIPIFISLFFVLKDFEKEIFAQSGGSLEWLNGLINIVEPVKDGWGPVLIAIYVASQLTSTYLMSTAMQSKAQRYMIMVLPVVFLPFILRFPVRADDLLAHDEPLDDRARSRHAPPHAKARRARQALEPDAPEGGAGRVDQRRADVLRRHVAPELGLGRRAAQGQAKAREGGHGDERVGRRDRRGHRRDRRRGQVGGAPRARAARPGARSRARAVPGRLRGRARAPRRRLHAGTRHREHRRSFAVHPPETRATFVRSARELVERVAAGIGADVTASAREHDAGVTVTCSGPDVALFIGKHGQTIDAIQYLANAIARAAGADHEVIVDAAGYRARRTATLENLARRTAQRASATGRRVALEPMTPVERKIVHEALKEDPEVETASEGSEPNRFVVVFPRPLAG